ncbi:hypothetical protein ZIOFF_039546 [Zingiber officinale]|uniref:dUTP diphosphatase n=1 Tax=Zingiber officinale TaxID=94328 RepID=A0A8J5G778_ZINOF|nr:hypothetical protein ZIOFF_039546 [Zingiber officinale]
MTTRTTLDQPSTSTITPLFDDQIREYRRNQQRLYNAGQATRKLGRRLSGGSTSAHTLKQQIDTQAQLRLFMQEREALVPAEVLYHSRRDDAHHRVYAHRSEEPILVIEGNQLDRSFIQEDSFRQLQRSHMQYIHLGVLQIGDQAIIATMEVDLTHGSQLVYIILDLMLTIASYNSKDEEIQSDEETFHTLAVLVGQTLDDPTYGEGDNYYEPVQDTETQPFVLVHKISPCAVIPQQKSANTAGFDLVTNEPCIIKAKGRGNFSTSISLEIPYGSYGRIATRSSVAWNLGLDVRTGVIDSDYRREIIVLSFNHSDEPIQIQPGDGGSGSTSPTSPTIFSKLLPKEKHIHSAFAEKETLIWHLQEDFGLDYAEDTSPGASVLRSIDPALKIPKKPMTIFGSFNIWL